MYVVMRKLKGYTHFDFLSDDFTCAQYLVLLDLVNEELEEQNKESKKLKASKKGKR